MRISDWSSDVCSSDLASNANISANGSIYLIYEPKPETSAAWRIARLRSGGASSQFSKVRGRAGGDAHADQPSDTAAGSGAGPRAVDRKSVGQGKSVSVRVALGRLRITQEHEVTHITI